jgi:hypothetical protein
LLPRAFVLEIKSGEQTAFEGSRLRRGARPTQGGEFDQTILCQSHEAALALTDNYGVDFCRRFRTQAIGIYDGLAFELSNPFPDRLVRFAGSVLWRHAVSSRYIASDCDLGPYEPRLRGWLFGTENYDPHLWVMTSSLTLNGAQLSDILMPPYRLTKLGRRTWRFVIRDLMFDIKLDDRRLASHPFELRANDATNAMIINAHSKEVTEDDGIMEIVANMG